MFVDVIADGSHGDEDRVGASMVAPYQSSPGPGFSASGWPFRHSPTGKRSATGAWRSRVPKRRERSPEGGERRKIAARTSARRRSSLDDGGCDDEASAFLRLGGRQTPSVAHSLQRLL
jgi:hypothetical protein